MIYDFIHLLLFIQKQINFFLYKNYKIVRSKLLFTFLKKFGIWTKIIKFVIGTFSNKNNAKYAVLAFTFTLFYLREININFMIWILFSYQNKFFGPCDVYLTKCLLFKVDICIYTYFNINFLKIFYKTLVFL